MANLRWPVCSLPPWLKPLVTPLNVVHVVSQVLQQLYEAFYFYHARMPLGKMSPIQIPALVRFHLLSNRALFLFRESKSFPDWTHPCRLLKCSLSLEGFRFAVVNSLPCFRVYTVVSAFHVFLTCKWSHSPHSSCVSWKCFSALIFT